MFCDNCGYFEEDPDRREDDTCGACGCQWDEHSAAMVVVDLNPPSPD